MQKLRFLYGSGIGSGRAGDSEMMRAFSRTPLPIPDK